MPIRTLTHDRIANSIIFNLYTKFIILSIAIIEQIHTFAAKYV